MNISLLILFIWTVAGQILGLYAAEEDKERLMQLPFILTFWVLVWASGIATLL